MIRLRLRPYRHRADHVRHQRDGPARRPRVRPTPGLVLGPLLRYTGESDATVWVETDTACEVEVLGHMASTFENEVALDGEKVWPDGEHDFPPCVIRTIAPDGGLNLSYGSCRGSVPHESPFTLA